MRDLEKDGQTGGVQPVTLVRTELRVMHSRAGRREYRIFVAWPERPAPPAGFPVVYTLDANATFGMMVESLRMRTHRSSATGVVPAVVIGIGYPTDEPYDQVRRNYDYTMTPSSETQGEGSGRESGETGGAREFLEFIEEQLKPEIERDFRIDRGRQTIFGHSLGGLFVLHLLLTRPETFRNYIAVSPSIWWSRELLWQAAATIEAAAGSQSAPADRVGVMISVGEYEQRLAPWQQPNTLVTEEELRRRQDRIAGRRMVDNARDLAGRLSALPGLGARVDFQEFAGEDHASVLLLTINRCLRFALAPP